MNLKEMFKYFKEKLNFKIIYIVICVVFLVTLLYLNQTHAYYNYSTGPVPIFTSKVGNFSGRGDTSPLKDRNTDINLLYMVQDITNPKNYAIMEGPPVQVSGYKINEKKSNCIPANATYTMSGSNQFTVDSNGLVKVIVKQTKPNQVVCRIYYDYEQLSGKDIIVFALKEDNLGMVIYGDKHYTMSETIPTSGYTYKEYSCKNTNTATEINYIGGKFTFKTSGPNICYAYFNKTS